MTKQNRSAGALLATMVSLSLAACETLGIGSNSSPTVSAASIVADVPKVENSQASPCWQQRQIAAQRSYIDSIITGKAVKYHADCKVPASPSEQKTS